MSNFYHCIISQFNVKVHRPKRSPNPYPKDYDWVEKRLNILENYTYKSILNQTNQNFEWLVFIDDKNTSKEHKDRINKLERITPVYISHRCDFNYKIDIVEYLDKNNKLNDYSITTSLDSDDCIRKDFIDLIQTKYFNNQSASKINFNFGYRYDFNTKYFWLIRWPDNPFLTVIENSKNINNLKTCKYHYLHWKVGQKFNNSIECNNDPMFIHLIHTKNVGSKIDLPITDNKHKRIIPNLETIYNDFGINLEQG